MLYLFYLINFTNYRIKLGTMVQDFICLVLIVNAPKEKNIKRIDY